MLETYKKWKAKRAEQRRVDEVKRKQELLVSHLHKHGYTLKQFNSMDEYSRTRLLAHMARLY